MDTGIARKIQYFPYLIHKGKTLKKVMLDSFVACQARKNLSLLPSPKTWCDLEPDTRSNNPSSQQSRNEADVQTIEISEIRKSSGCHAIAELGFSDGSTWRLKSGRAAIRPTFESRCIERLGGHLKGTISEKHQSQVFPLALVFCLSFDPRIFLVVGERRNVRPPRKAKFLGR